MNGTIAAVSFTVNGLHGTLIIIAVILFLIAAVAAAVREPHPRLYWPELVAAGLCLATLALIVSG
jgi:hypothetical protein